MISALAAFSASFACRAVRSSHPAAPVANDLSVTAYDKPTMHYAVDGHPRAGLVTITFKNAGDDAHEMALAKLKPGVTLARFKAALHAKDAEKAANALIINPDGDINGPQIVGPGLSTTAAVQLDAAHYVVICFLPGADGMPHALMGMVADMTVGSAQSAAQPPHTNGTITLTDSAIELPANFTSGGTFAVTNTGTKPPTSASPS